MGKSNNVAAVIGIIIGIVGVGLAGYTLYQNLTLQSQITDTWYDVEEDAKSVYYSSYTAITDISLSVNVKAGKTLRVLFTCTARVDGLYIYLHMYLDGVYTGIEAAASRTDSVGGIVTFSISMQYINASLSGVHVITIWGVSDDPGTTIYDSTLFAETL
ncbi:MAG: hypothetical protein JW891_07860 [Candidatus Lokiarchaeota archaeon]|nr:hypothetical protein [Candidatus Lokiarchaeota archaeon]